MSASTDTRGKFFETISSGDVVSLKALLERDPGLVRARHDSGVGPLMLAIYNGHNEIADVLIASGAEVDVFEAAALGRIQRLEQLLDDNPALVRTHNPDGWTALHVASYYGKREAAALLLARGADVGSRSTNTMANTALHAALAGGHPGVTELLLANGAEVNAKQHGGYTALHAAALDGDPDLTRLLLANGADASLESDDGQTALAMAREKGREEVLELLFQAS
jgi:ankyrin repeat protein